MRGKLGLTRCPGNRDFIRFEKKYPQVSASGGGAGALGGLGAGTTGGAAANGLVPGVSGQHVLEAQRVQLPPEVAAGLGAGGASTTLSLSLPLSRTHSLSLSHLQPPALPSAVGTSSASSPEREREHEREHGRERRHSLSSSNPNSQAPSLPPSMGASLSSTPNALTPQGSKVPSPLLRSIQAGGSGASTGGASGSGSGGGPGAGAPPNVALLPPPRVVVARYGRENPSLLPPNEDPRQMEALERAQVIREQMEAERREEEEEEEKAKREQLQREQLQRALSAAACSAAGTVSAQQLSSYQSMMAGTLSPEDAISVTTGALSLSDAPPIPEGRSKRKKDAAEEERKEKHARMLLEQEHERARYEKAQAQKRAAAALARQAAAAAGGGAGLLSPAREDDAAATGDADEEIEQEMIAAAELARLREEEAAGRMRLKSDSKGGVVGLLASSASSCDLALAANAAPHPHAPGASTRAVAAAGGAVLVPPPNALVASFSSPHLPALALGADGGPASPSLSLPPSSSATATAAAAAALSSGTKLSRIEREVGKLVREGTTHVMLLLGDSDFSEMGVDQSALHRAIHDAGIKRLQVSVAPGPLQLPLLIDLVQVAMSVLCEVPAPGCAENKLLLISKSGFRRAGTLAACILCAFGLPVDSSVRVVRDARGSRSLGKESRDQLVRKFDAAFKKFLIQRVLHSGELFHSAINRGANSATANTTTNHNNNSQSATSALGAATPPESTASGGTSSSGGASSTGVMHTPLPFTPLPFTPQLRATDPAAYALETPGINRSQIKIWPAKEIV